MIIYLTKLGHVIIFILLLNAVNQAKSQIGKLSPDQLETVIALAPNGRLDNLETVRQVWDQMTEVSHQRFSLEVSALEATFDLAIRETAVAQKCVDSFKKMFSSAKEGKKWSVAMIDSWGTRPSGILEGTLTSFGSYDECLTLAHDAISQEAGDLSPPAYCTLKMRPILPTRPTYHNIVHQVEALANHSALTDKAVSEFAARAQFLYYLTIRTGLCLPSVCTLDDLNSLAMQVGKKYFLQGKVTSCETRDSKMAAQSFSKHEIISLSIISLIFALTIIGTVTDQLTKQENRSMLSRLLSAFSASKNAANIFKSSGNQKNEITCLHGIRFWTMAWIILGHTAVWSNFEMFNRVFGVTDILIRFSGQTIFNATLSVETFFLLSGLLTGYLTWLQTNGQRSRFNSLLFFVSRYFRLTPGVVCVIALLILLPRFGDGPLWTETTKPVADNCLKNWWVNLIYMQNYIDPEHMCHRVTWWLSMDMHFHIASWIVVVSLLRRKIYGILVCVAIILSLALGGAINNFVNNYPPAILTLIPAVEEVETNQVLRHLYRPYLHGPPFFIGFLLGYLLTQARSIKLSQIEYFTGWLVAMTTMFSVLCAPYPWNSGLPWTPLSSAIFAFFERSLWSLSIGWIIFACATGHGGPVDKILSWRPFAPLSRMTYMVYLTHGFLLYVNMGKKRTLVDMSSYSILYIFIAHWTLSYFIGFIATVLFESPFLALMKIFYERSRAERNQTTSNDNIIDNNNRLTLEKLSSKNSNKEDSQV